MIRRGPRRRRPHRRRRGRGRGARHRHRARRPDRGAGAAGHLRPGPRRRTGRCGSARSSRTSATPRPPPASPGSSRWSWRCGTGRCRETLHVDEPTPHVDWSAGAVRTAHRGAAVAGRPDHAAPRRRLLVRHQRHQRPRHHRAGPAGRRRRRSAGPAPAAARASLPWTLVRPAAAGALRAQAARLLTSVAGGRRGRTRPTSACSLATTRAACEHRAVVVGRRPRRLLAALAAAAARSAGRRPGDRRDAERQAGLRVLRAGRAAARHGPGAGRGRSRCSPDAFDAVCAELDAATWTGRCATCCAATTRQALDRTVYTQAGAVRGRGGAVPRWSSRAV